MFRASPFVVHIRSECVMHQPFYPPASSHGQAMELCSFQDIRLVMLGLMDAANAIEIYTDGKWHISAADFPRSLCVESMSSALRRIVFPEVFRVYMGIPAHI